MANGEGSTMRNFIVCTLHLILVRVIKPRRLRWAGHVARMEEGRRNFKMLTGTPSRKRPLGRSRRRKKKILEGFLISLDVFFLFWIFSYFQYFSC